MSEQIMQEKFSVKLPAENFEQILKTTSTLVEELTFNFTQEGITFRTMDPSHVALIDIALPNTLFEKYETTEGKFGLNIDQALKVIKQFDKSASVSLEIKDNRLFLTDHELSYDLALIEASSNDTPLPKIPYDSLVSLYTKDLRKYLTKLEIVSQYCTLKTENYTAQLSGKGDLGNCKIILEKGKEELLKLEIKQDSEASFSLEYIMPYLKSMIGNYVQTFEFSTEKPLRIDSKIFNTGRCHFYLAPRVEN